jgi:hypothetical protein
MSQHEYEELQRLRAVEQRLRQVTQLQSEIAALLATSAIANVAAARSEPIDQKVARRRLERWVAALPDSEKSALLYRFATEEGRGVRADLLQRFRNTSRVSRPATVEKSRTVGALLDEAERRTHQATKRVGKRGR